MSVDPENRTLSDKFMLRLPDGMRDRIRAAAEANNRSMNAEIVARLAASFDGSLGDLLQRFPPGLMERISVASGFNDRSFEDEVVATLLEKFPPPRDGENERLLRALRAVLASLSETAKGDAPRESLRHTIDLFEAANPAIAGPLAREFLQHLVDSEDGTQLSKFRFDREGDHPMPPPDDD